MQARAVRCVRVFRFTVLPSESKNLTVTVAGTRFRVLASIRYNLDFSMKCGDILVILMMKIAIN